MPTSVPTIPHIETLIGQGRYSEARAQAEEALKSSSDFRYRQLFALAVSKSGAPKQAMEYLEPVYREHPEDAETAGILGGIYKDIFRKDQNTSYAILSRDTYLKNFSLTKNYYTGINAATMSAIAGQAARGREIAAEVIALLGDSSNDFWEQVTLAEAYLLSKNREKAINLYFEAKQMAATDWGKVSSVHNQLWLLNHYVPVPAEVLRVFSPPGVVAFIGHMLDHPSRTRPRFPASIEGRIKENIAGVIKTLNARIGYCSLACGSDILFAEAMAEAGGEVNIWLPFSKEDFLETSVRFAGDHWVKRFEDLIARFPVNYLTQEPYEGYDDLFSFQTRVIFGSAVIRSTINHTKPTLLTVLSETDLRQKEGGTRDTVNVWPYHDGRVNINPDNFIHGDSAEPASPSRENTVQVVKRTIDRPVLYLLCASLPGGSEEEQQKFWIELQKKMEISVLAPVTFEIRNMLAASFPSILGVMDLAQVILGTMKSLRLQNRPRISLHASPAILEPGPGGKQKQLAAASRARFQELHSLIPPGNLYSFARFSSVLALDLDHYSLDYAGVISSKIYIQPLEIYTVKVNATP